MTLSIKSRFDTFLSSRKEENELQDPIMFIHSLIWQKFSELPIGSKHFSKALVTYQ